MGRRVRQRVALPVKWPGHFAFNCYVHGPVSGLHMSDPEPATLLKSQARINCERFYTRRGELGKRKLFTRYRTGQILSAFLLAHAAYIVGYP